MSRLVPNDPRHADAMNDALELVESRLKDVTLPQVRSNESLKDILTEVAVRCTSRQGCPVRVVRQFACTGGSIISRAIQAQPNTLLLSEVDPFNVTPRERERPHFVPTDLIGLADSRIKPLSPEIRRDMFLASFKILYREMRDRGQNIVLREHSHGWFCTDSEQTHGPSLCKLLRPHYDVVSLVTVRHPFDSWLSLNSNGWVHFSPSTLDEYARRYRAFLDDCGSARIIRYEDFVNSPDRIMQDICQALELGFNESWKSILSVIRVSGDSGRSGSKIAPRERREVPEQIARKARESEEFMKLCSRLGYSFTG